MSKSRYVKVQLSDRCSTNLQGATVVGQDDGYLIVERAQVKTRKPRQAKKAVPKGEVAEG